MFVCHGPPTLAPLLTNLTLNVKINPKSLRRHDPGQMTRTSVCL